MNNIWRSYHGALIPWTPPHLGVNILRDEIYADIIKSKSYFARWTTNFDTKTQGFNNIELIPNKDILLEISKTKSLYQTLVGFALESDNERNNAISKLTTKNLDLVVLNSLNDKDAGFGIDTNKITLIDSDRNIEEFDSKSKYDVAKDIFNKILKIKK